MSLENDCELFGASKTLHVGKNRKTQEKSEEGNGQLERERGVSSGTPLFLSSLGELSLLPVT